MKCTLIIMMSLLILSAVMVHAAAEDELVSEAGTAPGTVPSEEDVVDFTKLQNPFSSQLPREKISKTPVVKAPQTIDNTLIMNKEPAHIPQANVVFPQIKVQGIIYGVKDPQAIIDDQVYSVGDMVQGARIQMISKKGIQLFFGERAINVEVQD